ncbi:MAG: TatD family hydrolase [Flavobacteriales bacterium]|nr:TatD family hydrolase [Flavobacteriales bacterium]MCX7769075.1 TatD family hydrolase [Flavobacteriales bacterium]MDW8410736.1 TatD family hydrolase [Flavobacteriales bacterium]
MSRPPLIDTHCHLYDKAFDHDREACIQRAWDAGVQKILLPNIDSSSASSMLELARSRPTVFRWMAGLHPCSVPDEPDQLEKELHLVEEMLSSGEPIAVGEIGIDLYWRSDNLELQKEVFIRQCHLAIRYGLPVSIHSRNAIDEVLDLLTLPELESLTGVLHCFTGNLQQAQRAIELNFYLGVGGVLTYKNSNLREILPHLPLDRLVLETDAPYLPPVPHRGRRNEPAYLTIVLDWLSRLYGDTPEKLLEQFYSNSIRVFHLD